MQDHLPPRDEVKQSGATVQDDASGRLQAISLRLAALQAQFSKNVVHAVEAWSKHVVDEMKLAGIPHRAKERARQSARDHNLDGFRLTIDSKTYQAVMRHADDREVRREVYEAYSTLASDRGPMAGRFDNGPLIDEILACRHEAGQLVGFPSYADALAGMQMASSADDAERFLLELNARVRPRAQAELQGVWALAKARDGIKGFRPWDLPYYSEKLSETKRGFADEEPGEPLPAPMLEYLSTHRGSRSALATIGDIELALFDLRLHRDYVPAERSTRLRSQVLDTFAQVRRQVSLLPPPPWDRSANRLVDVFGEGRTGVELRGRAPTLEALAGRDGHSEQLLERLVKPALS
jgi:Zn-dependent oligopeptidase